MNTLEQRLLIMEQALKMAGLASKMVLTFDEAVQFTGLSKSYLYKLTCKQKVPHYKPSGKLLYFNREELQSWLLQKFLMLRSSPAAYPSGVCLLLSH